MDVKLKRGYFSRKSERNWKLNRWTAGGGSWEEVLPKIRRMQDLLINAAKMAKSSAQKREKN